MHLSDKIEVEESSMATKTQIIQKKPASKKATKKTATAQYFGKPIVGKGKVSFVRNVSGLNGQGVVQVGKVKKLELRDQLGMTRQMFGRIVNVAERSIAKIEAGEDGVEKIKRPYNEVYRLWEALCVVVEPESIGPWFQTPNDSFDGMKPMELIERGEIDQLWNVVFELQTGMPG
jgi:DNA-binding XRE family transcriptional regulator